MKLVKGSKVLIPWSGGMDSTYLVYKAIMAGCEVTTAYYEIENNSIKVKAELKARNEMMDYFRTLASEHGTRYYDRGTIFKMNTGGGFNISPIGVFSQTPLWVLASAYYAADYDCVAMGFVQGDETISWQKEYIHLFDAYKKIRRDFTEPSKVKLIFPISRTKKDAIHYLLPIELKYKTWTCEDPINIENSLYECGCCLPCKTHLANTQQLNYPAPTEDYSPKVIEEIEKQVPSVDSIDSLLQLRTEVNKKIRDLRKKSLDLLPLEERCQDLVEVELKDE